MELSAMLMPDRPLEPSKMIAAFGAACAELGIGDGSLDVAKRERLAHILLGFVSKGEDDIAVLHRRGVVHFRNTAHPGG
jgi:hypothetical protein